MLNKTLKIIAAICMVFLLFCVLLALYAMWFNPNTYRVYPKYTIVCTVVLLVASYPVAIIIRSIINSKEF